MLDRLRDTTKTAITTYITNYGVDATPERRQKMVAHAETKILKTIRQLLIEAQQATQKQPPGTTRATLQVTTILCGRATTIYKIFQDILKTDFEIDTAEIDRVIQANKKKDLLLEDASGDNYDVSDYTISISWFLDNPHVNGPIIGPAFTYTIQDHLKTEWDALQKGIGVDLDVTLKGSKEPPLRLHRTKLLMHSAYFAGVNGGAFIDSKELHQCKLELNPQDCSRATFQYLIEFIYLGAITTKKLTCLEWIMIYQAADIYEMARARELALAEIQKFAAPKLGEAELKALFQRALVTGDEKALQICFCSIDDKAEAAFISIVDKGNWHLLYRASEKHPSIRAHLLQCRKYNPSLMDLPLEEPKKEAAPKPAAAASSSAAAASASGSLE